MRKVFPLKQSENCEHDAAEESQENPQAAKQLEQPAKAGMRKMEPSAVKSMRLKVTTVSEALISCDNASEIHGGASGDENLPKNGNDIHHDVPLANKPSSAVASQKTQRASAYPVFTAGSSGRLYASSMRHSDKQQRLTTVSSSTNQSSISLSKHASRETVPSESANCEGRPLISTRNNRVSPSRSTQKQKGSFIRSSSLRMDSHDQLPDLTVFPSHNDEEPVCCQASDSTVFPRSKSLSRTTSEMSYSETSSDCGSCFTEATDSNSSSSGKSESISSLTQSPVGNGNTPFNLSARTVAEKLVKVLGKERLLWQASRRSRTNAESPDGRRYHRGGTRNSEIVPPCTISSSDSLRSSQSTAGGDVNPTPMPSTPDAEDRSFNFATSRECDFNIQEKAPLDVIGSEASPNDRVDMEARTATKDADLATLFEQEGGTETSHRGSRNDYRNVVGNLEQEINRLRREKRDLALEVARESRARIADNEAALQASKHMETEMERKISAIEKDKASMQESLERELEKRSEEWSFKLAKIKSDERKMMKRLAKMAEEKNELEKEIAGFKIKEASWREEVSECQDTISALKERVQASEEDMVSHMQTSSAMAERLKASTDELEIVTHKKVALELENSEMQKEVTRLRRVCNEQEMTIEGLWREFDEAVNDSFECRSEQTIVLQRELLRLARVEQDLRSEVNAIHAESCAMKQRRGDPGAAVQLWRDQGKNAIVDQRQDLQSKANKLETKLACLQEENRKLTADLRKALREKGDLERSVLRRQQSDKEAEETTSDLENVEPEQQQQASSGDHQLHQSHNVDLLHWKLEAREAEIEELYDEIAQLVSNKDSLQMEVDDLHEKLGIAHHRIRELERKIDDREETIESLGTDAEKRDKELSNIQGELSQVKQQREEMRKEAECMREEALRLTLELAKLRKVADKLEEEVMLREGQITILRTGSGIESVG